MDQRRSIYDINSEVDISLKFPGTGRPGFVLERNFSRLGIKRRTWYLKVDLEDTQQEEEELEGMEDEEDDPWKMRWRPMEDEEETHDALVLAMKIEWDVWLEVLPFPPALGQFEPGVYTMMSTSLNPGVLKGGIDFGQLNYRLLDFVQAPKVFSDVFGTSLSTCTIKVIKLTLSPGSVELTALPITVQFGEGRLFKKVPKLLLGQMFSCNFVEFNPNPGPSMILANIFELPFISWFKPASVEGMLAFYILSKRKSILLKRNVFEHICAFLTACFLDLSPSDPRRQSTIVAGCWRGGRRKASPRLVGW